VASLTSSINRGVVLLQEGKPEQAASLYRQILHRYPDHADALHLLSVAVYQGGDARQAVGLAERAIRLAPSVADYHSNLGRYYLAAGRLEEARSSLERALELAPDHTMAMYNLALTHSEARRWNEARPPLERYIALKPEDPAGHHQLGLALSELGHAAEAIPHFCRTIELAPAAAEAYNNLGNALQAIGKPAEALPFYNLAMTHKPGYADAMTNLGAACQALGEPDQALGWFERALAVSPGLVQARGNIANLLAASGRQQEALAMLRAIATEAPGSAETWNNLGNSHQELGQFDEAMEAYGRALAIHPGYYQVHNNIGNALRRQGRYEEAVASYRVALEANPHFVEALNNQAVALADLGRPAEAVDLYERALAIKPDYVDPLINMGNIYRDRARPAQAIELFRRATQAAPANPFGWNNLGCALSDEGEVEEALACFRRSLELDPGNPHTRSNLLLNLHYRGGTAAGEIAREHERYGQMHGRRGAAFRAPFAPRAAEARPLRVGYVSADFRRHSVAFFIEPVLAHHDPARVEAYCYADVGRPDALTRRFAEQAGHRWRDLRGYNDQRFAALVRADAIDILVDLGGHTANSRLMSFTTQAAPVQIAYLGYPNTTGLDSIGYRLTDASADPDDGRRPWHAEELVRLDGCFLCFRPPADAPEVAPLPAASNAPFTFGSFNNHAKLSDGAVAAWAEILRRTPGARLALKNKALGSDQARRRVLARFAAHGIGPERLWMSGPIDSLAGHLNAYGFVDLALDTFPYAGTTTTCEAMWMGVPVVTLAGEAHVERTGASLLAAAGLPEFVTGSPAGYIERATACASSLEQLAALRAGLRPRLAASVLMDEAGFTRRLEDTFYRLWQRRI